MAKHRGSCVHLSRISTCGTTSRETVSYPQRPPLPTLYKISSPVYVIATNKRLQPLTSAWYNSRVLSLSLLKIYGPCIVEGSALSFAGGAVEVLQAQVQKLDCLLYIYVHDKACIEVYAIKCHTHTWKLNLTQHKEEAMLTLLEQSKMMT